MTKCAHRSCLSTIESLHECVSMNEGGGWKHMHAYCYFKSLKR